MTIVRVEVGGSVRVLDSEHCACKPCEGCTARAILLEDLLGRVASLESKSKKSGGRKK